MRASPILAAGGVFLAAGAIFYLLAAPGLGTEDGGELAAGARLLAMVHAPGYPLYLLAGRIFSSLSSVPGRGLVLFSVFCGASAVTMTFLAARRRWSLGAGLCAAATLLFCRGLMDAATAVEVYALQSLLMAALLGALLRLDEPGDEEGRFPRLGGLLVGLTLTHHMGLLILLPAILPYAWYVRRERWRITDATAAAAYALLGLLPYLALLLLSHREGLPIIWWPGVETPGQLLHVASGASFKKLLFAVPVHEAVRNFFRFPGILILWFPLLGAAAAAAGIRRCGEQDRPLLALLGAIILITVFHASNYNVLDPEVFLMPAVVPFALLAGAGFRWCQERFSWSGMRSGLALAALGLTAVAGRLTAGGAAAQVYNSLPADVGRAVLARHAEASSDGPALVWADWKFFPVLKYFQLVEGLGAGADVELDTTAESPGVTFREGRTWCMSPSFELGRVHALVMEDLHWKVLPPVASSESVAAERVDTGVLPLISLGGIDIVAAPLPEAVAIGRPIAMEIFVRRNAGPGSDTVLGELVLLWDGRPRLSTPFAPRHWNRMPTSMAAGEAFVEPVQTIIPSAHADGAYDSFALALRLQTADSFAYRTLGPLNVVR